MIYSQVYLSSQGLAVTWDNPDIQLYDNGAPIASSALHADHEYEVRVRVWNGSYDAPAIGLPVSLSYLTFGIATTSTAIATITINLGAKGAANHPAFASFVWRTPREPGHYCLQALLGWHDDANPNNNLGQENVQVGTFASPAKFMFTVRNEAAVARLIRFDADAYAVPPPPPCESDERFGRADRYPSRAAESRARWDWAVGAHARERFPVPDDWTVTIEPARIELAPGARQDVRVTIETRSASFQGAKPFNVHGFVVDPASGARRLIGGVTLIASR